jgi:hypothetical protein
MPRILKDSLKRFMKATNSAGAYTPCLFVNSRRWSARLCNLFKEYAMSGANRPSGPATRKSLDLADQIERDELENNLPDALSNVDDEDDIDDENDSGRALGR